ncbi:MAG: hypothetical protein OSJ70_07830 [Bacilli bacterium]|nr:hypothetical protein [Bacilli bacterium]
MKKWKKFIIIFVIIADVITLTFFTPIAFKTIIPSPYNFKQMVRREDLTLEVKEGTLTREGVTIVYKNNTDKYMSYGSEYFLEYKMFGDWFIIKPTDLFPVYNLMLYSVEPHSEKERLFKWEGTYGHLHKGKYRIVHDIVIPRSEYKDKYTYVEFEIK